VAHSRFELTPRAVPRGEIRVDALTVGRLVSAVACVLLRAYRLLISPLLGRNCRFEPSCSQFTEQAISRYGASKGATMGLRRLLRCHPWGGAGGFDPVP
jgi:putative membrane protein insertion efficiency factor